MTELNLDLRRVFKPYLLRDKRYSIMVAHRRCGKTVACVQDLILRAISLKLEDGWGPGRYAYVAPLYSQAKEIAWDYLQRFAAPVMVDKNVAELHVTLLNGSRIRLHGADNPDRLRGGYLDGCVLDEYADMRPSVLGEVVRPMLADRKGWLTAIGTPKGRNAFHQLWVNAQSDPRWFSAMLRASETGLLDPEELADARKDMTQAQYLQEFECSFEAAILGAYYAEEISHVERDGRIRDSLEPTVGEPIHTAWDLGHGANMVVWVFQVGADGIRVLDCISREGWYFKDYLEEVASRGYRGSDFVPHDIVVPNFETGRSRVEVMVEAGRNPVKIDKFSVDEGINAVKLTLPKCIFDGSKPEVQTGIEALRQYRQEWDEKTRVFKQTPLHNWASHFADAFRYLALGWRQMVAAAAPPAPVVMRGLNEISFQEFMDFNDAEPGILGRV